ncbi:MAG: sugar ABC transporter permease [Lachnospiraceae bacterium]|nr:sugar ABC transporter permease [Lachnospiraceae bacterium]
MKQSKGTIAVFLAPAIILFAIVFIYPVVRTVGMSFNEVGNITADSSTWSWTGISNYVDLMNTRLFRISMVNFLKIWIFTGIATLVLALLLATILTSGIIGQKFFRAVIYMPNVISGVAVGYMWLLYVFNADYGLLHSLFLKLGWETAANFQWLSVGGNVFLAMCIAYVFSSVGYYMLMYISGIEKISKDYYESATLDGANGFQKFMNITLPLLKGVIGTSITLWTSRVMGFFALSQIFNSTETTVPMKYVYQLLFGSSDEVTELKVGKAAAAAVVMTVTVTIISMVIKRVIKDENYEI